MIDTFYFVRDPDEKQAIGLSPTALATLARPLSGQMLVSHGCRRIQTTIVPIPEEGRTLPVDPSVFESLGLVEGVPYRLRWDAGELRIGPVIGILIANQSDEIDISPGSFAQIYLLRYAAVGGLVYVFGANDIDFATETVTGYCWMPGEPEAGADELGRQWAHARAWAAKVRTAAKEDVAPAPVSARVAHYRRVAERFLAEVQRPEPLQAWSGSGRLGSGRFVQGRFPLPSALWRRTSTLSQKALDLLVARMGARFFNSYFFDKQEGHRMLSADRSIRRHLPVTEPLASFAHLLARVKRDGKAILKQVDGHSGFGLMRVEADADGYLLRFREQRDPERFLTPADLEQRLEDVFTGGKYMLQQCIDVPECQGRPHDYRVMMQKDDDGQWVVRGIIGRFGRRGSIVSNFIDGGFSLRSDEALKYAFGVDRHTAHRMEAEMIRFAIDVCRALERAGGCYGDLGLDLAFDRQRRLWLYEVNKIPSYGIPRYAGEEQMHLDIASGPLLFAARLAGFGRS